MNAPHNPEIARSVRTGSFNSNVHDLGSSKPGQPPVLFIHGSGPGVSAWANWRLAMPVIAQDRRAIAWAQETLRFAAGNFYINDKPTGAVVGQQPFGGGRASGTNDKAGAAVNLLRWTSPRSIKETFVPPTDYRYPYLG